MLGVSCCVFSGSLILFVVYFLLTPIFYLLVLLGIFFFYNKGYFEANLILPDVYKESANEQDAH